MKLMTLNTHSLVESSYEEKKEKFIETLIVEQPDVVALQEVNQTASAGIIPDVMLAGYKRCMDFGLPVREDNHAKEVVEALREKDVYYYWTWLSAKIGYGKYDEGMALLSKKPIMRVKQFLISQTDDYDNWKTRKILGMQTEYGLVERRGRTAEETVGENGKADEKSGKERSHHLVDGRFQQSR